MSVYIFVIRNSAREPESNAPLEGLGVYRWLYKYKINLSDLEIQLAYFHNKVLSLFSAVMDNLFHTGEKHFKYSVTLGF